MLIFSTETSCDETAVAILKFNQKGQFKLLSNQVSSQIKIHAPWGGIVPNLAAREHSKNILPVIKKAFSETSLSPKNMDLFCVTSGPGLIPALLIGVNAVKTLSYFYQKPLIGVHHIEGHIYSNYIQKNQGDLKQFKFPILNLVISGGHTQLILMKNHLEYEIIGQTQDDAVGEAFDKVAKLLGFEYPGGPIISQQAQEAEKLLEDKELAGKYSEIKFPRPMMHTKDFNFSFSGLKTAVLYFYQRLETQKLSKEEPGIWKKFISKAFQEAVVEVLQHKTLKAIETHEPKTVLLSGGVSANNEILKTIKDTLKEQFPEIIFNSPEKDFCGDNAAMIGVAGISRYLYGDRKKFEYNWKNLEADSNLKIN
ncbi:MAG: tRNA (adenosine(37)-N6)-threonylcarbamoyltransferase complex transferase subunit TsaD [Candidatus Moranbacteria bacterium]|nr:tRNA (adenosine(37)-N6)-threonylcarbamoyltransferase complex transferase subunit TsaD [Candidatus Moranbacteria bacterium]